MYPSNDMTNPAKMALGCRLRVTLLNDFTSFLNFAVTKKTQISFVEVSEHACSFLCSGLATGVPKSLNNASLLVTKTTLEDRSKSSEVGEMHTPHRQPPFWAVLYTNKSQIKDKSDVIETLKDVDPIRSVDILECDVQKFRVFD